MKEYKIIVSSVLDDVNSLVKICKTSLNKEVLLQILYPLTPYQVSVEDNDWKDCITFSLEGTIEWVMNVKLGKTKKVKEKIKTEETLATFFHEPKFVIHTYPFEYKHNWASLITLDPKTFESLFPTIEILKKQDNTTMIEGLLSLNYEDDGFWHLTLEKETEITNYLFTRVDK